MKTAYFLTALFLVGMFSISNAQSLHGKPAKESVGKMRLVFLRGSLYNFCASVVNVFP